MAESEPIIAATALTKTAPTEPDCAIRDDRQRNELRNRNCNDHAVACSSHPRRHHRRPSTTFSSNSSSLLSLSMSLSLLLLTVLTGPSHGIGVCQYQVCTPNCICDYQFDDQCAMEYGNYGWIVPPTAQDYIYKYMRPDNNIQTHEIKPVGMSKESQRLSGIGYANGKILGIDDGGLVGHVYFEVDPMHIEQTNDMVVELYGGIDLGFSECDTGTLLGRYSNGSNGTGGTGGTGVGFSASVFPFPNYNDNYVDEKVPVECHPRFRGAIVGAAEFDITNIFAGEGGVWYPREGETDLGELRYCVRVRVNPPGIPPLPNTVDEFHYIDTKFKIQGDRSVGNPGFAKTSDDVRIYTNQAFASKKAHAKANAVDVRAFLCAPPPSDDSKSLVVRHDVGEDLAGISATNIKTFGIGQEFTVCVGPGADSASTWEVVGFRDVVCENTGQRREIVSDGVFDAVSALDASTIGHVDYTEMAASGTSATVMHPGTLGVRTTVTSGWLQIPEDRVVTCIGTVELAERAVPLENRKERRRLLRSGDRRNLQDRKERGNVAEFEIPIRVDNSTVYTRGEVPYPDDDRPKTGKSAASKTFLAIAILLFFGAGGMAGWWWWRNHGEDMLRRRTKSYSSCSSQCKLEEICDSHSDHRRSHAPFEDGTSSDDDDDDDDHRSGSQFLDEDGGGSSNRRKKQRKTKTKTKSEKQNRRRKEKKNDGTNDSDEDDDHLTQSLTESFFSNETGDSGRSKKSSRSSKKERKRHRTDDGKDESNEKQELLVQSLESLFPDETGDDDDLKPRRTTKPKSSSKKPKKSKKKKKTGAGSSNDDRLID